VEKHFTGDETEGERLMVSEHEKNRKANLKFYENTGYLLCGAAWGLAAIAFFMPQFKTTGVLILSLLLLFCGAIIGVESIYRQEITQLYDVDDIST